jgi:hypothetical protein
LIPTALVKGILPCPELLNKYSSISIYTDFVNAIKQGNIELFDKSLLKHQAILIKWGTWLVVERTRILVVRQLFRKIWVMMDKPSRITIDNFHQGVTFSSKDKDISTEHVSCLIVNLIASGYMKGYISHEKQTVVLSNKNPFPVMDN